MVVRWGREGRPGRTEVRGAMATILHPGATLCCFSCAWSFFTRIGRGEWVGFGRRQAPGSPFLTSLLTTVP